MEVSEPLSVSQRGAVQCPICLDPMHREGDHQIATLECGHLFGYQCVSDWLASDTSQSLCPTCRKRCNPSDVRRLHWDGTVPMDNSRLESLRTRNAELTLKRKNMVTQIGKLEHDISICNGELARSRRRYQDFPKPTTLYQSVTRPSIILEKRITNGHRLCLTPKFIIASHMSHDESYGLEIWDVENLSNSHFIRIHSGQIHDIVLSPFDQHAVATVAFDKRLVVTSLRTDQATIDAAFPVPPMCCAWLSHSTLAVGGAHGNFFIVNGCSSIVTTEIISTGPPVMGCCRLSDTLVLASTPMTSRVFNYRDRKLLDSGCHGAQCVRSIADTPLLVSRSNGVVSGSLCHLNGSKIAIDTKIFLPAYFISARPALARIGDHLLCASPDERNELYIAMVDNTDRNLWNEWRGNFSEPAHPTPIMDVAIGKYNDVIIATVSSGLVRVYAVPAT